MSKEEQRKELIQDIQDIGKGLYVTACFDHYIQGQKECLLLAQKFQQLQLLKETETKEQNEA